MNLLLDTHTFLWFSEDNPQLSNKAKSLIEDPANICYVSMTSIWEMAIKINIGKLKMKIGFSNLMKELVGRDFEVLPISFEHTLYLTTMELHHRDPFDRLLIAQAMVEELSLVSNEGVFDLYRVKRVW